MAGVRMARTFQCNLCLFSTGDLSLLVQHDCMVNERGGLPSSALSAHEPGSVLLELCSEPSTSELSLLDESSDVSGDVMLDRWEDQDCKLLMACWSDHKHLFGGKIRKKVIFDKIANAFNEKSNRIVSGDQCMRKWNKMVSKQKEIEDHNNKSGNDRKTWKYYDDLSKCLSEKANINPVCTMESSLHVQSASHTEDEELDDSPDDVLGGSLTVDGSSLSPAKGKKRCRKRPSSRSSAAEMLNFLQEYSEKREKTEEEKLTLLREMKEEKKQFYNRFFEFMEKQ